MEMETARSWLSLIAVAISVGSTIWMYLTSGSKKTASELSEFRKQDAEEKKALLTAVQKLGERTQALESELKHLPDAKSFMDMRLAISELSGKLGRMEENQMSTSRTVLQVQEFLMKSSVA